MKHIISMVLAGVVWVGSAAADDDLAARIAAAGDTSKYPSAACVVVLDDWQVDVRPNGLATTEQRQVLKILTDAGVRSQAVQVFDFDPVTNRFQVKRIRIHRADGAIEDVALDDIITAPAPVTWGIFWGAMYQTIAIPRLEAGDCLETVTSRTGFNLAYLESGGPGPVVGATEDLEPPMLGHWHDTAYFHGPYPIIEKRYTVRLPKDKPLQYEICHGQLTSSAQFEGDKIAYTFVAKDMPVLEREPRMIANGDVACKLVLATVPDWIAKSKWFHDANINQFNITPEIQAKTDEIIAGITDDTEKIRMINCWVADKIRYVGNSRGVCEGYTMHASEETFSDRGGVCKDKAGMCVTMLRAAGFDAYPVMTQAGSAVERTPADQFNHAVVAVRGDDGELTLVDPTWSPKSRELWSSRESRQHVVYGLPEGYDLGQSPYFPPEHNAVRCTGKSRVDTGGRLETRMTLNVTGYADTYFRRGLLRGRRDDQRGIFESWLARLGSRVTLTDLKYSDPWDYTADATIEAAVAVDGHVLGSESVRAFRLPLLQHPFGKAFAPDILETVKEDKERDYGMRMRATRLLSYSDQLTLPDGWTVENLPEERSIDNDAASLEFKIEQRDGAVHYTYEVTVKEQTLPAESFEGYYEVNKTLHELADAWVICRVNGKEHPSVADAASQMGKEVTR